MLSAGRNLLQRVPRNHLLLRPASTSVVAPYQKRTDHELLSLQINLKQSGDKQVAKQQLQRLLSDGKATAAHCNWALENVSTGVKFDNGLIAAMEEKNIPIDEEAMALVKANRLHIKGKEKMRRLQQILSATKEGKNIARKYFKTLQQKKTANATHYGWAMKELCETSDEMRGLMESMKQNGIVPNVVHFTQFISNLLHDGDLVAAQHVYDVDMPAARIEPNDRTKKTMAQADKLARRGRARS